MENNKKTLLQRINAICEEAAVVEKDGYNSFSKYKYLKAQDVIETARRLMCKHGVVAMVNQESLNREKVEVDQGGGKIKTSFHSEIRLSVTFFNVDNSDDNISVGAFGAAADSMDKDPYKAITSTLKYIYINTFKFPVEMEDVEKDAPTTAAAKNPPAKSGNKFL